MLKKLVSLLSIALICSFKLSAQQIITFDSDDHKSTYKSKKKKKELYANSISTGTLSLLWGYVPFYYERKATDFLSIRIGAGITFRSLVNDFGQVMYEDGENSRYVDMHSDNNSGMYLGDLSDQYYHYKYRSARPGYFLSVAPKFYFHKHCMDGFYIAPEVSLKAYNYSSKIADVTKTNNDINEDGYYGSYAGEDDRGIPRTNQKVNEHMNFIDYTLTFGGHYQSRNKMAVGWSISAGARQYSASMLDMYIEYDQNASGLGYLRNTFNKFSGVKPVIMVNLILGGCF